MGINSHKGLHVPMDFLTMAKVARTTICMRDKVSYESGERKNQELLSYSSYILVCTAHSPGLVAKNGHPGTGPQ